MKKLLFLLLLFTGFCKEPTSFWNPQGEFPLLLDNGTTSSSEKFSLENVADDVKVLIINFYAPDCPPCVLEVPDMKTIYNDVKDNPGIRFIAIGSKLTSLSENIQDANEAAPDILKFTRGFKLPYQSYVGITKNLVNYGLTGFPETFVLYRKKDRKWYIKRKFIGSITEREIKPFFNG